MNLLAFVFLECNFVVAGVGFHVLVIVLVQLGIMHLGFVFCPQSLSLLLSVLLEIPIGL